MKDPIICEDGYTYERNAILQLRDSLSPMTRQPIDKTRLIPNRAIKDSINKFNEKNLPFQKEIKEKLEKERIEKERVEKKRLDKINLLKIKLVSCRVERRRAIQEQLDEKNLLIIKLESIRLEKERIKKEKERVEKERLEKERIEKERPEKERVEKERVEKAKIVQERIIREQKIKGLIKKYNEINPSFQIGVPSITVQGTGFGPHSYNFERCVHAQGACLNWHPWPGRYEGEPKQHKYVFDNRLIKLSTTDARYQQLVKYYEWVNNNVKGMKITHHLVDEPRRTKLNDEPLQMMNSIASTINSITSNINVYCFNLIGHNGHDSKEINILESHKQYVEWCVHSEQSDAHHIKRLSRQCSYDDFEPFMLLAKNIIDFTQDLESI